MAQMTIVRNSSPNWRLPFSSHRSRYCTNDFISIRPRSATATHNIRKNARLHSLHRFSFGSCHSDGSPILLHTQFATAVPIPFKPLIFCLASQLPTNFHLVCCPIRRTIRSDCGVVECSPPNGLCAAKYATKRGHTANMHFYSNRLAAFGSLSCFHFQKTLFRYPLGRVLRARHNCVDIFPAESQATNTLRVAQRTLCNPAECQNIRKNTTQIVCGCFRNVSYSYISNWFFLFVTITRAFLLILWSRLRSTPASSARPS